MKIELLKTFLEVSQTLHFRIAAENLFVTQSAVSARIKLLEDDLGVLLFDRSQKQLKITPEGNRLVKHAKELIFMWQKAKQEVSLVEEKYSVLSIGSMMSIWDIALQEWLNKITRNIEEVSFFTQTYNQTELKKSLLNGVTDIAFTFDSIMVDGLITEKVTSVPLHLVTSDPNLAEDYQSITDFIMVDYGESINLQYVREYPGSPPARHLISQPRVALDYILSNGGCAYLPRQLVMQHISEDKLFLVEEAPIFNREIFALYLEKSHKEGLITKALHYFPEIIFS
ncbi:MAG: DNA-binding transcriptional LysR family regulator [Candidatus Endobugula sp.]